MKDWKCRLGFHEFWEKDLFTTKETRTVQIVPFYPHVYLEPVTRVKATREHEVHWKKCAKCGAAFEINAEIIKQRPQPKEG